MEDVGGEARRESYKGGDQVADTVAAQLDGRDSLGGPEIRPPAPRRRRMRWSFVVAGVAIAGAILYLVLANTGATAEYYMTISQLRACSSCSSRTVRVSGFVLANTIVKNTSTQVVRFAITDAKATAMPVTYSGVVPDIFQSGAQVVVEGRLESNGVFSAENLLTKCPSKFQAASAPPGSQ